VSRLSGGELFLSLLLRARGYAALRVEKVFTYSWGAATRIRITYSLVNPAYDMDMYIFKVAVFIKLTKFE